MSQGDEITASDWMGGSAYSLSSFRPDDVSDELALLTEALYGGDRRLDQRVPMVGVTVRMRADDRSGPWQTVVPVNFSRSGMRFHASAELTVGSIVWLDVQTNRGITGVAPFKVAALVRHVQKSDTQGYSIGVEFRLNLIQSIQRIQIEHCISRLEGFLLAVNINNGG